MKIVPKIDRCNEARALARNLANYPVSDSENDVQGIPGRVRASKIEVGRATFERKTLEGRKKTDREHQRSAKARQEHAKVGRGARVPAGHVWNHSEGSIGGALRAPLYVHDEIHTAAAEAAALAAAPATVKSGIAYA